MSERPKGKHESGENRFWKDLAIMVLGSVVVAGIVLGVLAALADNPVDTSPTTIPPLDTTTTTSTTTTTVPETSTTEAESTTTTIPLRPPQEVTVRVLNSGEISGAAGRLTQTIAQAGFQIMAATDFRPAQTPSRIWFRDGFALEANDLLRFIPGAQVEELPDPTLSPGADVIMVLGTDYEE
jgi:hypothetical protein